MSDNGRLRGERFARLFETPDGQLLVTLEETEDEDADTYQIANTMSFAGGTVTIKAGPYADYDVALDRMETLTNELAAKIAKGLTDTASKFIVSKESKPKDNSESLLREIAEGE